MTYTFCYAAARFGLSLTVLSFFIGFNLMGHAAQEALAVQAAWSAQKPMIKDGAISAWVPAPEFLQWRAADPGEDGFAGRVLRVNVHGPFHSGAWSQHAGALYTLPRTIAAGEPFTLRFQARSLEGARFLTVLRTWGGAKPWESIPLTPQWKTYEVTLIPDVATEQVTFSLVPSKGGLQPYAAGQFELHRNDMEASPRNGSQGGAEEAD